MEIVSRSLAIERGFSHYYTGVPCKSGHLSKRRVKDRHCVMCVNVKGTKHRLKNLERLKRQHAAWYEANKSRILSDQAAYREANGEKERARCRKYREENIEKERERSKNYQKKNKDAGRTRRSAYRARKLGATAAWDRELTEFVASEASGLATARTQATGFAWHVDHMYPLRGDEVCGLHVWNNLQVIPGRLNQSKGGKMMLTEPGDWIFVLS